MGYYTNFYGKLKFTRKLMGVELAWVNTVMREPSEIATRTRRLYMDARKSGDWDNDRDNARMQQSVVHEMKAAGYILTWSGQDDAGDMCIAPGKNGLIYTAEKPYDLVSGVNFIVTNARRKIPDFGLQGSLFAQTEFEPYTWLLKINEQGWAEQVPCRMAPLLRHSPRAYMQHLRWNWSNPSAW